MTNNGTEPASEVEAAFAGILSELEDVATKLTTREAELARELADVQAELHRIESVRAAMVGEPRRGRERGRTGSRSGGYKPSKEAQAKIKRVQGFAAEREEFAGSEVAELLGVNSQGVGPLLAGMVRRGELTVRTDAGRRVYTAA